jgi:two-component system catabolic regulation response regulator CreB
LRKRLLIVEDDPDIAWLYRYMFESTHAVTIATGLEAARHAVADPSTHPDLILLDIGLPDGSGLDLCQEVKSSIPDLPVVVISANRLAGRDAARSGADAFLPKPVDPEDIESLVGRLLAV